MAESDDSQKTEEPSARRLAKAFEEGSVPKSHEVSSWFSLAGGAVIVAVVLGPTLGGLKDQLAVFLERPETIAVDGGDGMKLAMILSLILLKALAIPLGIMALFTLAGHFVQHRPTWSTTPMDLNLEKLSPLKGFERLFGLQGIANFAKAIFKLVIISGASAIVLWPARSLMLSFVDRAPEVILPSAQTLTVKVLIAILVVFAVIAAADLFFQRMQHRDKLKMTKQEVKDEQKETEGDPKIKAKIRQIRMERTRRRMIQAMRKATVVVTNPTHFAVALRYDQKENEAPVCVAKGVDELALRIRFAAKEHKVPIVENPPLARALYASVELDEVIPQDHYKAVAEVIGYVMRLKNRGRPPARRRKRATASRRIN